MLSSRQLEDSRRQSEYPIITFAAGMEPITFTKPCFCEATKGLCIWCHNRRSSHAVL